MLTTALISGTAFIVLVNTHPLIQTIQPYPTTNYQQNAYRLPYSEAYIVQPNKISPYSQQHTIQTPLPYYQTVQAPLLTEHVNSIYWDKLMSNPSLRSIIDPNTIAFDQYGTDRQNLYPYNTGGVVNNYIIVPPDYIKLNETVAKEPKDKKVKKKIRDQVKENGAANKRKKKVLNSPTVSQIQEAKSPNNKTPRKINQNEQSRNFNTDIIKCFTTADVLDNEKYKPEKKDNKNKEVKNKCNRNKSNLKSKSTTNCENKSGSQKSRKLKRNQVNKNSKRNENNKGKEKTENISSLTTPQKKKEHRKKELKVCKCADELPTCETKLVEDIPLATYTDQDMNDLFLSSLLQQGCTNLENRHTRNSKADKAMKDFLYIYPDLSEDISKSLNWYMNDFLSPHSLQQGASFNAFLDNKYPFDLSHMYQIPQYSNIDVNKSKGNSERNKNTRRKKKKKKNSKSKTRKENDSNNDDSKHSQIPEKNIQISDNSSIHNTSTQILDLSTQSLEYLIKYLSQNPQKNLYIELLPDKSVEGTPVSNDQFSTQIIPTNSKTSIDKVIQLLKDSIQHIEEMPNQQSLKTYEENIKSEKEDSYESYETQIPHSVVNTDNKENGEILKKEEKLINEILPTLDHHIFNQLPEFGPENELFYTLLRDYYPDFRADNHAYLVSDEESDVRNVHDRYFYVTDENIDSREIYSSEHDSHIPNKRVYNDKLEYHSVKNAEKDKSEEIVFRTPPALDVPDFITRKINRDAHDSTEIHYQHNLEDDFDRFNLDNSAYKSNNEQTAKTSNENNSGRLVETVYAKSKVVKYGQTQGLNKQMEPEAKSTFPRDDFTFHKDGEKTVIIAKSLHPEDYW